MKTGSNTLVLIIAILAFVPVLAVDFLMDSYVRNVASRNLQRALNAISQDSQASIYDGIDAIGSVVAQSPSMCTPTFLERVHDYLIHSTYVRQIIVENRDKVQYCDAFGLQFPYVTISRELTIPGRNETVSAVTSGTTTFFKVTRALGSGNTISSFVQFPTGLIDGRLPENLQDVSLLRIGMSDGTELLLIGSAQLDTLQGSKHEMLVANSFAGDLPVRVEAALPFTTARASFVQLYFVLTLVACGMSGALLLVALQYVRRGNVPDFDLERAIVNGEIKPYYQPVVNTQTGRVVGCEMLARWIKANGKIISPGAFIDYAEVTGLAIPMTLQLMEQVRKDLWELSVRHPGLKISINLFEGHFRDTNIVEDVQAVFGGSTISYRQLVFELTERHPVGDETQAKAVMSGLRALGCRFAMDDLGTGHSNLAFLQKLGLDIVKIDKVFVEMIDGTVTSAPVLEALIKMGQELGADLIAEGVETDVQAQFLKDRGVYQIQGFMFAPALPAQKYIDLVDAINGAEEPVPVSDFRAHAA
ncbi:MAG: EAL domain-containing protein [Hyphomicrobiaceae bacterium]|nr:EAL domain-containing protein [Hyphomicrobiaceae bacterium]